jgi:hypothetical protein
MEEVVVDHGGACEEDDHLALPSKQETEEIAAGSEGTIEPRKAHDHGYALGWSETAGGRFLEEKVDSRGYNVFAVSHYPLVARSALRDCRYYFAFIDYWGSLAFGFWKLVSVCHGRFLSFHA